MKPGFNLSVGIAAIFIAADTKALKVIIEA